MKRTTLITIAILMATIFTLSQLSLKPAHAAGPLCVRPTGNDGGSCTCTDTFQYCRSVQRAINLATTGDTIRVAEGWDTNFIARETATTKGDQP